MNPDPNFTPPLLVVLSGSSGVGKDAAIAGLKELGRPWHFAITATTRPPRAGEQEGVDYIFLDDAAFTAMREKGEFLECAEVYGRWYGVPRSQVRQGLDAGQDVILKIDVQGAETVRRLAPDAVFIFMVPGSIGELRRRLASRMTETSREIELRLRAALDELARGEDFGYRVVNTDGNLERTVSSIDAIITAERCRAVPRRLQLL